MSSVAFKIKNYIKNATNGYTLADNLVDELNLYSNMLSQNGIYPYIWYNAKYSSESDSGTPANATSTTVFNLGTTARDLFVFEATTGDINPIYDQLNQTNGVASTLTSLLDVSTIGTDRPLFDLTSSKTIACGQSQANGHFTFAVTLNLATTTSQTLLTSTNTGGLEITTNGSSQVVFGQKSGTTVTFTTAITTAAKSIIVSWDSFSGQAILYIDGKQVASGDEQTLLIDFASESLTVGDLNGTAQNIMMFNDFLDWEKARDLAYLLSYQHNILEMPQVILTPSSQTPFSSVTRERVRADANYPYNWSSSQYQSYTSDVQDFKANGGVPVFYYDADLSVNPNLFKNTETFATQTVDLPLGTFTFYFESGSGSITSSDNTGVATNHGVVNVGQTRTITVTTAGTFDFTLAGAVSQASLAIGSTRIPYQSVTTGTPSVFNLGTDGATGTGTFTNGDSASMVEFNASNNKVFNFDSSNNDYILTDKNSIDVFTYSAWFKVSNTTGNKVIFGSESNGAPRFYAAAATALQWTYTGQVPVQSVSATINTNWHHAALTYNISTGDWEIFYDGVSVGTGNYTYTASANNIVIGARSTATTPTEKFDGELNDLTIYDSILNSADILGLYNAQKAKYGL